MYDEDYPEKEINVAETRAEAKRALTQLRSSNILMGNNYPQYDTSHNATYVI